MRTAALLTWASCALLARDASAYDRLQPPDIATGQRAGLAGDLSKLAIGAGDVERGAFSLPTPFTVPGERGELQASIFPTYNPDNGISPWGVGFDTALTIKRTRIVGTIDYTDGDELTSPFGRLVRGSDGDWYPIGLEPHVRVRVSGDELIAYQPDGSVWTFGGSARVVTARGTYAWHLREIRSATDRRTTLTWSANDSGQLFLASVAYGGVHGVAQYRVDLAYETVTSLDADDVARPRFVDYRAGVPLTMDRRVKTVSVLAKNAQSGAFEERWHYTLGYTEESIGAAFYLARIDRTFASGETAPPVTYGYNLRRDRLSEAQLAEVPQLTQLFQQLGVAGDIVQPQWSAVSDENLDGNEDLELGTADRTLVLTRGSGTAADPLHYEVSALPPSSAPACTSDEQVACTWAPCRPSPSYGEDRMPPRLLAQLSPTDSQLGVVAFRYDGDADQTELSMCTRDGVRIARSVVSGAWNPRDTVRFVDLDHDHRPDLVRVSAGRYDVRPGLPGYQWGAPVGGDLLGRFGDPVDVSDIWVSDASGDGVPDLEAVVGDSLYVWHGLGGRGFASNAETFGFVLANGDRLTGLASLKLIPADLNKDGLQDFFVTNADPAESRVIRYFTNVGGKFVETRIPALEELSYSASPPVIGGFDASGNTTITVTDLGHAYSVALDGPETGLMAYADDGKGTVVRFGYARGPAEPGIRHRCALLAHLEVQTSGYDTIAYDYSYGGVTLHSIGRFPLGFAHVARREPLGMTTMEFLNEDIASGLLLSSTETDTRVPDLARIVERSYDDATLFGIPTKHVREERTGWRTLDGLKEVVDTTTFGAYDGVCPTHVTTTTSHGTLVTETTRSPVLPLHLHCMESRVVRSGSHADPALDFRIEQTIARNAAGQLTELATLGPDGPMIEQRATYDGDGDMVALETPGKGTLNLTYDPGTKLLASLVGADGVVKRVSARDPRTDALLEHVVDRGALVVHQDARYDGQERLVATWNDADGSSATTPAETFAYRYATTNTPAAVVIRTLAEAGIYRERVELATGADEKLATATHAPGGWVFDGFTAISRATREHDRFVIGNQTASPLGLDYQTLLAGQPARVGTASASAFGFTTAASETFHTGIAKQTATALVIDDHGLARTETVNGLLTTRHGLDPSAALVMGFTDEAGTTWSYGYDALGRLRDVALPDGAHHRVGYDNYGRIRAIQRDGVGSASYAYRALASGPNDQVATITWTPALPGAPRVESFVYDAAGRMAQHTFVDASGTRSFAYTWLGDLAATVAGPDFTKTLRYRADGKLVHRTIEIPGFHTIETDLDYLTDGRSRGQTFLVDGQATALHDSVDAYGRVAASTLDGHPLATYAYDTFDRASTIAFANSDSIAFAYDSLTRQPIGHTQMRADGAWPGPATIELTRNARGFVGSELRGLGADQTTRTYDYSAQGFLTGVSDAN